MYWSQLLNKFCFCFGVFQNNSLSFNKYAYLTTHNSYAIVGEPSHTGIPRVTFDNQEDTVTDQLNVPSHLSTIRHVLLCIFPRGIFILMTLSMICRMVSGRWCLTHMTSKEMYGCAIQMEGNAMISLHLSILNMPDSCRILTEGVQIAVCQDTLGHCRNQHWTPSRKLRRFFHPIHLKSSQ